MNHDVMLHSYGVGWSKVIPSRTAGNVHTLRFADGEFKLWRLTPIHDRDGRRENTIGS